MVTALTPQAAATDPEARRALRAAIDEHGVLCLVRFLLTRLLPPPCAHRLLTFCVHVLTLAFGGAALRRRPRRVRTPTPPQTCLR